jgi:hypothetical protein
MKNHCTARLMSSTLGVKGTDAFLEQHLGKCVCPLFPPTVIWSELQAARIEQNEVLITPVADRQLWIGLVELRPLPSGDLLLGAAGAFTRVVTWASNTTEYRQKAEVLAEHLNLYVMSVEGEEPVACMEGRVGLTEEIADLISRAESNPEAILYGTFHTYLFDEA